MKASLDDLTPEQREALLAYAKRNGRHWKVELALAWASGRDEREPEASLLRQIRNSHGPSWLHAITLRSNDAL
jgi:hypothetical protein